MSSRNEEPATVLTPAATTTRSSRTRDNNNTANSIDNDNRGRNRNKLSRFEREELGRHKARSRSSPWFESRKPK